MSYKVDLHTHSLLSPDGGLKLSHYKYFLDNKLLDHIAITDHNDTAFAFEAQRQLGSGIIVGEEIMTSEGEIIGLYLTENIEPGLSPVQTVQAIKKQGGIVYIPHPFETVRSGISEAALQSIIKDVDIIETYNGRAYFQNKGRLARKWAKDHTKAMTASSDTHGRYGWGYTFAVTDKSITRQSIVSQLKSAECSTRRVGIGIVYPKLNRLRKALVK